MTTLKFTAGLLGAGLLVVSAQLGWGADLRFDESTSNNGVLLPHLNFRDANGHIPTLGGSSNESAVMANGNTLGIYYNQFDQQNAVNGGSKTGSFPDYPNPEVMAQVVQSWINAECTTTSSRDGWIALNEISSSTWNSNPSETYTDASNNQVTIDYHTWCADVMQILKNGDGASVPAHTAVILFTPFGAPAGNKASWQAIAKYAYIGDERYIDGPSVQTDGYSVSTVQSYYQASMNAWVNNAGVPASDLILTEEYTNSTNLSTDPGNGLGASGMSGQAWQEAIEVRALAAYNVGFTGYVGYAWDKNSQNSDSATLQSYEKAYASTMVVQTEVPTWTGNDSDVAGNSWADYLNWTGGLPSTTSAPYPLLASTNPNLPKQTAANFVAQDMPATTITLDGNQSITTMSFSSPNSYTITPGTGGTLTFMGSGAALSVIQGSHSITASVNLASDLSVNLTGNFTFSGALTNNGHTLSKSGNGILTISGAQNNSAGSSIGVSAGTLNLNSDAGLASASNLGLSASGGSILINSVQHLSSLALSASGSAVMQTNGQYIYTHSVSVAGSGALDLTDNDLIDDYSGASQLPAIQLAISTGYNHAAWNGAGIISSAAATHVGTALGYAEASDVFGLTGSAMGVFDGQIVDSTTVLVKYTWVGDANLDGVVNSADLARMAAAGTTWSAGDFNYDGVVNADDYALFALGAAHGEQNIWTITPEPEVVVAFLAIAARLRPRGTPRRRSVAAVN